MNGVIFVALFSRFRVIFSPLFSILFSKVNFRKRLRMAVKRRAGLLNKPVLVQLYGGNADSHLIPT